MLQNVNGLGRQALREGKAVETRAVTKEQLAFGQILAQQMEESVQPLRFSKHATERANQRGVEMTPELTGRLQHAVDTARGKGAREIAVIGSEGVFIVNIKNSVVVTSISNQELKDNIITNIDSAVIL